MSIGSITGSGSTSSLIDAIKVWRAGAVAASQAVSNQPDPRGYVQVEEQSPAQRRQQAAGTNDNRRQSEAGNRGAEARRQASGPSSAFIAQSLAQSQETPSPSRAGTGGTASATAAAAYAGSAALTSPPPGEADGSGGDILPPPASASLSRGIDLVA